MWIRLKRAAAVTLLGAMAGCAGVPLESGRSNVIDLVQKRSGSVLSAATTNRYQVEEDLRREPLQLATAVQIALLRNPTMQVEFARIGLSAADVFEASRLSNPGLSFAVLLPWGSASGNKVSAGATLGFSDLLLRQARTRIARSEYQRTQELVAARILALAVDVQTAWFESVAATQRAAARRTIEESAQATAELAKRYLEAGNIDQLTLQLQAAAASEAQIAAQQAAGEVMAARARLQALLGLNAAEAIWTLPDALPAPVADDVDVPNLQELAQANRLDLAAVRSEVQAAEQKLETTRHYRYLGRMDMGAAGEREPDGSTRIGPSVSLGVPLFNQGQGAIVRAQATLGAAQAAQISLDYQVGNEVQLQADRMRLAHDMASSYRNGLIPQREAVVARLQEHVNFMLSDAFNLLQAKQQEYTAYLGYINAVERYWSARTELIRAVGTRLPGVELPTATSPKVQP